MEKTKKSTNRCIFFWYTFRHKSTLIYLLLTRKGGKLYHNESMGNDLSMPQRVTGMLCVGEQRFSRFILSSMCLI